MQSCVDSYSYWHKYLNRELYVHRVISDAASFVGIDIFYFIYAHGFTFKINTPLRNLHNAILAFNNKDKNCIVFSIIKQEKLSIESTTRVKKLISQETEELEVDLDNQILESSRINVNLIFGGAFDSNILDLPVNDKLYISKYKHIVKDDSESFADRESLFAFFRYYTISDEERKKLWRIRIGNKLGITRDLYDQLCTRLDLEGIKRQYDKLIGDDLFRTLPNYGASKVGENMYKKLHLILSVFQLYRPDIGYVQGMSFLIVILYYFYDEYDTFVVFCNLILTRPLLFACYDFCIPTVSLSQKDGCI